MFEVCSETGKKQGAVYLAFAANILQVKVHNISDFPDTAGFMDKTDPYVKIFHGTQIAQVRKQRRYMSASHLVFACVNCTLASVRGPWLLDMFNGMSGKVTKSNTDIGEEQQRRDGGIQ